MLVAANGARVEHVQQTVVYGDVHYGAERGPGQADLQLLFTRYRAFVADTFGALDFRGILQIQHATRIDLTQIYIPIDARPQAGSPAVTTERASLHDFVSAQPFLVVLGDPGSGKSTLVRHILISLARGDARSDLGLDQAWLPIFFPVAAFAEARSQPGRADLAPLDYLSEFYQGHSQPDYVPLFTRALELGRALLLFDGLDEVREERRAIVQCLEAFVRKWDAPGNRFLATSRIVGYDDAPFTNDLFATVVIEPLADEQITAFIQRWSRAYQMIAEPKWPSAGDLFVDLVRKASNSEVDRRIATHAASLSNAVFADPGITELARNPLLLTILALIHNQGARLPDRRVDLYRLCVQALAETWNRARSLSGRPVDLFVGNEPIDERFVVNLLGPIALWIHGEQPGGLVDHHELETRIAETLMQTDGHPQAAGAPLGR
jgi:predicted NACHT family NTPase